jgi:Anthranilate/para-aminobenzoate synthases component I
MNLTFQTQSEKRLGDLTTPVQMYLKLRDIFPNALLLESSDYHSKSDANSFICLNPIATIEVNKGIVTEIYSNGETKNYPLQGQELAEVIKNFAIQFKIETEEDLIVNGLFGYIGWDAIPYFETVKFKNEGNEATIPEVRYSFYQNIIVFNHFHNEIQYLEFQNNDTESRFEEIKDIIRNKTFVNIHSKSKVKSNPT